MLINTGMDESSEEFNQFLDTLQSDDLFNDKVSSDKESDSDSFHYNFADFLEGIHTADISEKQKVDITSKKFEKFLQDTLNKYNSQKENSNFAFKNYYEYLYTEAALQTNHALSNLVNLPQLFYASREFNDKFKSIKALFKTCLGVNIKEQNIKVRLIEIFESIKKKESLYLYIDRFDHEYFTTICKTTDMESYDPTTVYLKAYIDYVGYVLLQHGEFMHAVEKNFDSLIEDYIRTACKIRVQENDIEKYKSAVSFLFCSSILHVFENCSYKLVALLLDVDFKITSYVTTKMKAESKDQAYIDGFLAHIRSDSIQGNIKNLFMKYHNKE